MDIYSYLKHQPYVGYLIFGFCLLLMSGIYTSLGRVYMRFEGWTYRSEKPNEFWRCIACYFFGGVFFVGLFLYKMGML